MVLLLSVLSFRRVWGGASPIHTVDECAAREIRTGVRDDNYCSAHAGGRRAVHGRRERERETKKSESGKKKKKKRAAAERSEQRDRVLARSYTPAIQYIYIYIIQYFVIHARRLPYRVLGDASEERLRAITMTMRRDNTARARVRPVRGRCRSLAWGATGFPAAGRCEGCALGQIARERRTDGRARGGEISFRGHRTPGALYTVFRFREDTKTVGPALATRFLASVGCATITLKLSK